MRSARPLLAPLLLLAGLWPAACGKKPELPDTPVAKGRLVFKTVCTNCHTVTGKGKAAGPDLLDVMKRRDAAFVREYVTNPRARNPQSQMPNYALAPEDVENVVAFLQGLPDSLRAGGS